MVEINWTHEAQVWLRDIYSYIATDNRDAAQRTIIGIFEKFNCSNATLDWDTATRQRSPAKFASCFYGHYRIAYLIRSDVSIDILGVFHGALNIERYLV